MILKHLRKEITIVGLKLKSLEEAKEVYGEDRLVPISFLPQIFFYVKHGVQPACVFESEKIPGKIVGWFLKEETQYVHKKWKENIPSNIGWV